MKKFEYKISKFDSRGYYPLRDFLSEHGEEGWEAFHVTEPDVDDISIVYFKREVNEVPTFANKEVPFNINKMVKVRLTVAGVEHAKASWRRECVSIYTSEKHWPDNPYEDKLIAGEYTEWQFHTFMQLFGGPDLNLGRFNSNPLFSTDIIFKV